MSSLNDLTVFADTIKQNVSALDAGKALGLDVRRNRCKCPIHGGHDYNCVLFQDERGYYCHVCHASGDCISLVQETMFGGKQKGTFRNAIKWLNDTFGLGMNIDSRIDDNALKLAKKRQQQRREKQHFREWLDKAKYDLFLTVFDILMQLEDLRDANRPKRYSDRWNDSFANAVRLIPEVQRIADELSMEVIEVRK